MIIGLTGSYCSGKDSVADYLVADQGFIHYSLSDELRKELAGRGIVPTRENLIVHGTALRQTMGNTVLARRVLENISPGKNYIITSIRHPDEVMELQKHPDFFLVNVDAPAPLRFARMKQRNRPGDPETFEMFLASERKESQTSGSGQQLTACSALAQYQFINDLPSLDALHAAVTTLLATLKKLRGGRPLEHA